MSPWTWYQLTNAFSGALFITLGILVMRLRDRGQVNLAFAWFSIAFGAAFVFLDLLGSGSTWTPPRDTSDELGFLGYTFCMAVAVAALVWLGLVFPDPLRRDERWRFAVACAFTAVAFTLIAPFIADVPPHPTARAATLAEFAIHGAMLGMGALFALRSPKTTGRVGAPHAVIAGALVLYPAFYSGIVYGLSLSGRGPVLYGGVVLDAAALLGPPLIVTLLWLFVSARTGPEGSRPARNVALLALLASLGGALAASTATDAGDHWGYGAARTVGVLVLAFAIVRGQLLGVDLQLRWGLSRGTVAAALLAAFFIASEGAQILFGQGNEWVGLFAAGALVFAIAPLQRAAERLAERAVPSTSGPIPSVTATKEADSIYEAALRAAARDGTWTRREEQHLAEIAETLGIGPKRALQLRQRIEEELGAST